MDIKKYNAYRVLGLADGAPAQVVKKRYRMIAMKFHPDRKPEDPKSVEMFELAAEAYRFLMNPVNKRDYDRELERRKKKEYDLKSTEVRKLKKRQRRGVYSRQKISDDEFNAFVDECRENFSEFFSKVERLK